MTAEASDIPARPPSATHCPDMGARDSGDAGQGQRPAHCPFSAPDAARFCGGIASLPAPHIEMVVASADGVMVEPSEPLVATLLLTRPFFRPPRA